jgi:hypothetical protein
MNKSQYKDKISGGLADKKKPSDFNQEQLEIGTKHEMEHTNDRAKAREIAMDHLLEDSQYYVKLKDIVKYDRIDEEADGKKEYDYGNEELDKKWKQLRKAVLDSSSSIMPIKEQEYQDDEKEEKRDVGDVGNRAHDQGVSEPKQEGSGDDSGMGDEQHDRPSPEQIEEMLRNEGYSDAEIAHIIHGHIVPEATIDNIKMDAEQAMSEHELDHKKRMNDLDYDLATSEHETNGLDRDHKKRMLDLEYEYSKKEKEMELKHKEQELELKLQSQKEKADKAKDTVKVRDLDRSRSQDAAKTSKDERAGK